MIRFKSAAAAATGSPSQRKKTRPSRGLHLSMVSRGGLKRKDCGNTLRNSSFTSFGGGRVHHTTTTAVSTAGGGDGGGGYEVGHVVGRALDVLLAGFLEEAHLEIPVAVGEDAEGLAPLGEALVDIAVELAHGLVEEGRVGELVVGDAGQLDAEGGEGGGPLGADVNLALVDDLLVHQIDDDPGELDDFLIVPRDLGLVALVAGGLEIDHHQVVELVAPLLLLAHQQHAAAPQFRGWGQQRLLGTVFALHIELKDLACLLLLPLRGR